MDDQISRRRVLATAVPALMGSVVFASCSRQRGDTSDPTSPSGPTSSALSTPSSQPGGPIETAGGTAPQVTTLTSIDDAVDDSTPPDTQPPPASGVPTSAPRSGGSWSGADFTVLDDLVAATNGEALIIVEGGETIHEWYRTNASYARDIASAQKSVLSMLVGRAIADGHFDRETLIDDVLGTGWTDHGGTSRITVRHMLSMTSGLDDALRVIAAPGERWQYSNAFAQLFDVLTVTTGRELNDIAREWLFDPAGAGTATFYERRSETYAPVGLRAGVRDLAAIGNVVLDDAHPSHDAAWLAESLTPSQEFNRAYGYLWWLNGQASFMLPGPVRTPTDGPLIPTAPDDLVAALGKDDQKLYISRELDLVVARLGGKAAQRSLNALSSFDAQLWTTLLELRG